MKSRLEYQLEMYKKGFPFLDLVAAATPIKGIVQLTVQQQEDALRQVESYKGVVEKFVPASGAASRMFKDLFEAGDKASVFVEELQQYPFYDTESFADVSLKQEVLDRVLREEPFKYGEKPKGQIVFHRYCLQDGSQERVTAFEEHLVEGGLYAKDSNGVVHLHYTVSPEHQEGFQTLLDSVRAKYEDRFDCKYEVIFSTQNPDTNIVAVNMDNTPYLKQDGEALFRPGGHGALLENLNSCKGDLIVVKNIDNVVNQQYVDDTVRWKKVLMGVLIKAQNEVLEMMDVLAKGGDLTQEISRCREFLSEKFCVELPNLDKCSEKEQQAYLMAKLNRPIRVCGMVSNTGEPGGGPYIVKDKDGSTSLQILEASQLDMKDANTLSIVQKATHFNPVDLVCSIKDSQGEVFDLQKFTDPETGFISEKSYQGTTIKAQELPGLWNGSMSNWNTIFVETPLITFNPVKTVADLLRPQHKV